ncbi:MAG: transporter substrate-binding domain-containing protein [Myxococcota bacterium]
MRLGAIVVAFSGWLVGCASEPVAVEPGSPEAAPVEVADPEIVEVPAGEPPPEVVRLDQGDLDAIEAHGALRVLVFGEGEVVLPRDGASSVTDRELAALFADSLGLKVEPIAVERYDDLLPALLEGRGDLVAARMANTEARSKLAAFSRPTAVVDELVIGKKGAADLPAKAADLAGHPSSPHPSSPHPIVVRPNSSYRESLDRLAAADKLALTLVDAPEDRDTESLVHDVGTGASALTVCDSDLFSHIAAYNDDVTALFPVATGRQIGWALRPTNPALKAAADAFLVSRAMTTHTRERSTGDLAEIRARGSIRILTRNNAVSYYLDKGNQRGFDYELVKLFAKENGLRVDVIVPPDASDLVPWLLEGKGDLIAAQMTVTPERAAKVAFSDPYLFVREVLVQPAGEPPITAPEGLRGKTIVVRPSSSYRATLDALQATAGPFTIVDAPEDVETEQLIAKVGRGEVPLTVADSTIAKVELAHRDDVQLSLVLTEERPIAYGIRTGNPALRDAVNQWLGKTYRGLAYNVLKNNTFENPARIEAAHADTRATGQLSPYDDLLKLRSQQYGLDWRLMASQAYQESRFDPLAKSFSGALGLFQVLPTTGQELGFVDLHDPDQGVHAGVKYMAKLIDQFEPTLPFKQRVRFALASYNVGKGHVEDARRLARQLGLDPDKWFGNVERAMLKLAEPPYARRSRYGYCRAEEPVHYVSEIQSRYESYLGVVQDMGPR